MTKRNRNGTKVEVGEFCINDAACTSAAANSPSSRSSWGRREVLHVQPMPRMRKHPSVGPESRKTADDGVAVCCS